MGFTVPTFNLAYNGWRAGTSPPAAPGFSGMCNLAWGRRVSSYQGVISVPNEPIMTVLLPPGEDLRGPQCALPDVCLEIPAGSGRFYSILGVDDVGKGFPNEHRAAIVAWTVAFGAWPSPIP